MQKSIHIGRMTRHELDVAVDWAAQEGWNPGLHDAAGFYATDPNGFFMAKGPDGDPLGVISAVAYDEQFGFIGFFIVRPDVRGHQVGIQLGQCALNYLGGRNIGLDGVENKIKNYERMGFSLVCHNYRCEGKTSTCAKGDAGIHPLQAVGLDRIYQYDRTCFPADRRIFLNAWLSMPESCSLACLDGKKLQGYGTIRRCRSGHKIGPLFADDLETADRLYRALLNRVKPDEPVYLDIPGNHPEARLLAEKHRMKTVFGTARMYSRNEPKLATQRIFGITTFELG
ncbi:MAG: GNAT family N-acetyltransferase [Kiritimatiellae bacterium]|nr:GNAT family N-acetyltransferase [Kiritimatiellia bacterium]